MQKPINDSVPFPCDIRSGRSAQRPTSVHALRPGDIDVIAAMGDSLTAGNGAFALNIQHLFVENRGVCAMIGTVYLCKLLINYAINYSSLVRQIRNPQDFSLNSTTRFAPVKDSLPKMIYVTFAIFFSKR